MPRHRSLHSHRLGRLGRSHALFPLHCRLIGEPLEQRRLLALDAQLLADVNLLPGAFGSSILWTNGSTAFLQSPRSDAQNQLWKTDGTSSGTALVFTFASIRSSYHTNSVGELGGHLFLSADDGLVGTELWRSDGTSNGTVLVKDLRPGPANGRPKNFANISGTLFFASDDESYLATELWKSDGSSSGTQLVKQFPTTAYNSSPNRFTQAAGTIFFVTNSGGIGTELWKSDGTSSGTQLVHDIVPGASSSNPRSLTSFNGQLFFVAGGLWKSDGTSTGTQLVHSLNVDSYLVNLSGTLYFTANSAATGRELWKSDGTSSGTQLVRDIVPGSGSAFPTITGDLRRLSVVGSSLFFAANDGISGSELWKSDGTSSGTVFIRDIRPGPESAFYAAIAGAVYHGQLYFSAIDDSVGREVWKSDGTSTGTQMVANIEPDLLPALYSGSMPRGFGVVGDVLLFSALTNDQGQEIWRSDGTSSGTSLLADLNTGTLQSDAKNFTAVSGKTFFAAADSWFTAQAFDPWVTDGTSSGTTLLMHTGGGGLPGYSVPSYNQSFTNVNGTLFFASFDFPGNAYRLWRSDGTSSGTSQVSGVKLGAWTDNDDIQLFNVNGVVYFIGTDSSNESALWRSDGTSSGTTVVHQVASGTFANPPRYLTNVNGTLYFARSYPFEPVTELWKSDGTSSGTLVVSQFPQQPWGNELLGFTNVNDSLFFFTGDFITGKQLWTSDGTSAGTTLLKNVYPFPPPGHNGPPISVAVADQFYFIGNDGTSGRGLWRSDGTSSGTVLVRDLVAGPAFQYISNMTAVGNRLFFVYDDGSAGAELWTSDGSSSGTYRVIDLLPGPVSSGPASLVNLNGLLYFSGNDGLHGRELWRSDGTSSGTVLVEDILPGPFSSDPQYLANAEGTLYFTADDAVHGREPWILRNVDPPEINVQRAGVNIADGDNSPSVADGTDFGTATANTSSTYITRQFTIQNTGTGTLNLGAVTTSDPANWAITQQPAATVAPGGSTTFKLRFQPTGGGFLSASVLIPNDDPNENPYDFAVRGYGITPGARIERNNLLILDGSTTPTVEDGSDFTAAGANVSAERVTREFTVKNTGTTTLTLGSVSVTTGTPAAWLVTQQPAASLAPGASTTFRVRFQPTATGLVTGTVHLPTSDPMYGDYTFDIRGVGTDATYSAEIEIRKGSVVIVDGDSTPAGTDGTDFGSAVANNVNARVTRQFTIYNLGVAPLVLKDPLRVFIDTTTPADWKVTKLPDSVIQPGGSTTFNVRFQPTSAGVKTATIRILNTDGNESPYDFAIQGLGTSAFAAALAERMAHDHVRHEVSDVTGLKAGRQEPALHGLALRDAVWQDDLAWLALRAADELLPPRERKK